MRSMEFQDVVRRRRMIRNYDERPVDPAVVDRALRNADARAERGLQPGLGVPARSTPPRTCAGSGSRRPTAGSLAAPDSWLSGMMRRRW